MAEVDLDNELVRYSRAGDEFHYRWAARRCLNLIYPHTELQSVKIEGSKESKRAGEYVIDVAEYYASERGAQSTKYYQLKHSTTQVENPFNPCDVKDTIIGFSNRFTDLAGQQPMVDVRYYIVTNRQFSEYFKNGLNALAKGNKAHKGFVSTITRYTNLSGERLKDFCSSLELVGSEGDYSSQHFELYSELSEVLAGIVDCRIVDSLISLVREHALPHKSDCEILCEDILQRFGVSSKKALFPAPPELEQVLSPVKRDQHENLLRQILDTSTPIIIHASGGVGKSVVARQLANSLPIGSLGIVYDCFGAGGYRNVSTPRHRHSDALVQIANEIASIGYCEPLMPTNATEVDYLRSFEDRLSIAISRIRMRNPDAVVAIFVDAADNAEMAAEHRGDKCFASDLLNIRIPDGCRIVELCRTERISLLSPLSTVLQINLEPFSHSETLAHLQAYFPDATTFDAVELCRLSAGNPRVQANLLNAGYSTVSEALESLGPSVTTVDAQIEDQLNKAVLKVKESLVGGSHQANIGAICQGLAVFPPYVPIKVLAAVANVSPEMVKSFVADLGRPFLHSESSVQFRDEPTESWFRNTFNSTSQQVAEYVTRLKPLASRYSYVSQVLPSLYLQSESYNELIELAVSDEFLPENSPVDAREIRVYRLQFAFKAALKERKYADAVKLAFLAGEAVAGDGRKSDILKKNIDLIGALQAPHQIQELAFKRALSASWDGSENVYSAHFYRWSKNLRAKLGAI